MKRFKKIAALFTAAIMATSAFSANAWAGDTKTSDNIQLIDGYQVYERNGGYYTIIDGKEVGFFVADETTRITDPDMIEELEKDTSVNNGIGLNSITSSTTDLSSGGSYTESVDVTSSNYVSPEFTTSFPSQGTTTLRITPSFNTWYWINTFYIKTTIALKVAGVWYSNTWITGYNLLSSYHDYIGDTASRTATRAKVTFWSGSDTTPEKEFSYTVCQSCYAS